MTGQSGSPPPSPVTLDSPRGAARLGGLRWLGLTHPGPARGATSRRATRDWWRAVAAPAERRVYPMARAGRGGPGASEAPRAPDLNEQGRHRAWSSSPPGAGLANPGPAPAGHGPALAGLCPEHRARPPVLAPALVLRPSPAPLLRSAGPRDPLAPRSFRVAGPILTWRRLGAGALAEIIECRATRPCPGGRLGVAWRSPRRPKNARRRRAVHP